VCGYMCGGGYASIRWCMSASEGVCVLVRGLLVVVGAGGV